MLNKSQYTVHKKLCSKITDFNAQLHYFFIHIKEVTLFNLKVVFLSFILITGSFLRPSSASVW
jgi:hypothetical protein